MGERERTAGAMTRRALALLRRLPLPIQDFLAWSIERFALFLVLIMVIPVLIVVFISATVIVGVLNWALGSPTGPVGAILAYGWLAAWTLLPVIITVRIWRAVPALTQLMHLATEGPDLDGPPTTVFDRPATQPGPDPATFRARIAVADAHLADSQKGRSDEPPVGPDVSRDANESAER